VDAAINSERLIFQIWLAAYSGIGERYPELGVLLGWNTKELTGLNMEFYDEIIVDIGQFGLSNRLGMRLEIWDNFQAGVEIEWPEREVWYRAWWSSGRVKRPYAWWRYSHVYGPLTRCPTFQTV
jgi:hypothetical protein